MQITPLWNLLLGTDELSYSRDETWNLSQAPEIKKNNGGYSRGSKKWIPWLLCNSVRHVKGKGILKEAGKKRVKTGSGNGSDNIDNINLVLNNESNEVVLRLR